MTSKTRYPSEEPDGVKEFIAAIASLAKQRCRFTAFAGAGISVSSGIPATGNFLPAYLAYCIDKWLHEPETWDPQSGTWPLLAECPPNYKARFEDKRLGHRRRNSTSPPGLVLQALGAVQDWRDAIEFLSRARYDREAELNVLGPPNNTVRDSFFQFMVRGKEPALAHRMLASLSEPLRLRLILTTNFDELIERAFEASGIRLTPFDVHLNASLPSPTIVLGQHAIVKLHGTHYGLRADLSLDLPPTESDTLHFASYLAGQVLPPEALQPRQDETSKCSSPTVGILVTGYSGSDERIKGLFRHALRILPNLNVFWICHTRADHSKIHKVFEEQKADCGVAKRIHIAVGDADLLTVKIYQELTGTLPPCGMFFPTAWTLPYPARIPRSADRQHHALNKHLDEMKGEIKCHVVRALRNRCDPLIEFTSTSKIYGTHAVCSELYEENSWRIKHNTAGISAECAWIDLDDVQEPNELFLHILAIISRKAGVQDPLPHLPLHEFSRLDVHNRAKQIANQLLRIGWTGSANWVVFLNGRENPGHNPVIRSQDASRTWRQKGFIKDWIDILKDIRTLHRNGRSFNIVFVLITCRDIVPWKNIERSRVTVLLTDSVVDFDEVQSCKRIKQWCGRNAARRMLVYTIIQFDTVRYPAAIRRIMELCRDRTYLDGWESENQNTFEQWLAHCLNELEMMQMFRQKPGGFLWMKFSLRERLRRAIRLDLNEQQTIHRLIGRWYGRLFISSGDPRAAFAVFNHAVCGIEVWKRRSDSLDKLDVRRLVGVIRHARIVLKTAESQLKRKLSEELTGRCLAALSSKLKQLLKANWLSSHKDVLEELRRLEETLQGVCLAVWHVEGDAERIANLANSLNAGNGAKIGDRASTGRQISKWSVHGSKCNSGIREDALLHDAFARIRRRQYETARVILGKMLTEQLGIGLLNSKTRRLCHVPRTKPAVAKWLLETIIATRKWLLAGVKPERSVRCAIRLMRRLVYLCMHEGQAAYLSRKRADKSTSAVIMLRLRLYEALGWAECGLELLRNYPGDDDAFVYHENARYRAHLGLIAGRLAAIEANDIAKHGGFRRAEATLLDAEAFIIEFPLATDSLSQAIVLLRRAEVKLLSVRSNVTFRSLHDALVRGVGAGISGLGLIICGEELDTCFRSIEEMWDCIERADQMLAQHLKNGWWLHLSVVLKVLVAECFCMLYWAGSARSGGIPSWWSVAGRRIQTFLTAGLGQLPSFYSRTDVFFLARVAEALCNIVELHKRSDKNGLPWVPGNDWTEASEVFRTFCNAYDKAKKARKGKKVADDVLRYVSLVMMRIPRAEAPRRMASTTATVK